MDREEFFRLKKVQGKKKRVAEIEENERRSQAMMRSEDPAQADVESKQNGGDMLDAGKDADVIF